MDLSVLCSVQLGQHRERKGEKSLFSSSSFPLLLLRSISSQFHGGRARNDLEREWGRERKGERDCRRMCRKKGERNKWPDSHIIRRRKRKKNSANLLGFEHCTLCRHRNCCFLRYLKKIKILSLGISGALVLEIFLPGSTSDWRGNFCFFRSLFFPSTW